MTGLEHVCLLLGGDPPPWFRAAVERLETRTDADVALVVRTDTRGAVPDEPLDLPVETETVHTRTHPTEGGARLPRGIVDRIAADADAVVQHGHERLAGAVLDATPGGVLDYRPGDLWTWRDALAYLPTLQGGDRASVAVRRLPSDGEEGAVVAETAVDLAGTGTWNEARERVHWAGVPLLADAVENCSAPTFEPAPLPAAGSGEPYGSDDVTGWTVARYALSDLRGFVIGFARNCATLRARSRGDD